MKKFLSAVTGWPFHICSLADVIEEEYDTTIEEYVAENYAELSAMNVIPAELREDVHAY